MKKAFVSIIIPVYNVEEYVENCIQSVLAQTHQNFEIIIVDDGSTDSSGKIVDKIAQQDKRIQVIHQKNKGLSGARNTGIETAKGDFIIYLDSDDYWHPEFLNFMLITQEKTKADVVVSNIQPTKEKYNQNLPKLEFNESKITTYTDPLKTFLTQKNIITNACIKLHTKESLKDLRFINNIYFEDVPYTTMLMQKIKKLAYLDERMYYYYSNPKSIMRTSFNIKKIDSYITVIKTIHEFVQKTRPEVLEIAQKNLLNKRIKMVMNQATKKQKNFQERIKLFQHMATQFQPLFQNKITTLKGLKFKHKITIKLLLKNKPKLACIWLTLIKV